MPHRVELWNPVRLLAPPVGDGVCQPSAPMPASRNVTLNADHRKVLAGGRLPIRGSLGQLLV